jgi:hypothetical protein
MPVSSFVFLLTSYILATFSYRLWVSKVTPFAITFTLSSISNSSDLSVAIVAVSLDSLLLHVETFLEGTYRELVLLNSQEVGLHLLCVGTEHLVELDIIRGFRFGLLDQGKHRVEEPVSVMEMWASGQLPELRVVFRNLELFCDIFDLWRLAVLNLIKKLLRKEEVHGY